MAIDAVADHVAVAVPSIEQAGVRWHDELGGGWVTRRYEPAGAGFAVRQLRYPGGAKLELLEPTGQLGFAARFLERHGAGVHHVTLKVTDLTAAIEELRDEGLDVVDVDEQDPTWHEAFLRPSQVGGLVIQLAWVGRTDEEWSAQLGSDPEPPSDDGVRLHGLRLANPRLAEAASLWELLGASTTMVDGHVHAAWPGGTIDIDVVEGGRAGPLAIRMDVDTPYPSDPTFGASVLPIS